MPCISVTTNFHIPNAPNITTHPATYGIKESFTFAFCSTLPVINCIPSIIPIINASTNPTKNNILYNKYSIKDVMKLTIRQALEVFKDNKKIKDKLQVLVDLGIGYLTLGEATPALSGGEAQRLKLASEIGKIQDGSVFIFDEPSIGLHPQDVKTLLNVFQKLIDNGATIIVIEHDLDVIKNSDYIIDMGPEGGYLGGEVVASGTVQDIKENKKSITGRYL